MMRRGLGVIVSGLLVSMSALLPSELASVRAASEQPTTLRLASLAPSGSNWQRVFSAWSNTLRTQTQGQLALKLYPGVSGDERDIVRKLSVGQLDMASLTTVGLGQVVRSVALMQMPGLFRSYEEMAAVRKQMAVQWDAQFDAAGYKLLGWGDAGFARVFSNMPILRPSDLRRTRPWVWSDDPVGRELMRVIGANGVPLGVPEVGAGLQTRMIDTVVGSPVALTALQWFRFFTHMSKQADVALVGATVMRKQTFAVLPSALQASLEQSAAAAHSELVKRIRRAEQDALVSLRAHGVVEYDTAPYRAEWEAAYARTREHLTERAYPKETLAELLRVTSELRR